MRRKVYESRVALSTTYYISTISLLIIIGLTWINSKGLDAQVNNLLIVFMMYLIVNLFMLSFSGQAVYDEMIKKCMRLATIANIGLGIAITIYYFVI